MDDNIRFFKEITENGYQSIFEHPYLAMYKRMHEEFGLKVQLNVFYRTEGFDLSQMSDAYRAEWEKNYDWLKLSFHSDFENVKPYEFSDYNEVYKDCKRVNEQIKRFASSAALAKTTTLHFCLATEEGIRALADNHISGLLGLFGDKENPRTSYGIDEGSADKIRNGKLLKIGKIHFASIDIVLNCFSTEEIIAQLKALTERSGIRVMIHEQYYYADYQYYQPDFEEKLKATFSFLTEHGYESIFFEDSIQ
ncbi:MAG: hypothetical protein J6K61_00335 [Clostridia bacterium]|nr:hypothetical protein [Clostridia bacterium]